MLPCGKILQNDELNGNEQEYDNEYDKFNN